MRGDVQVDPSIATKDRDGFMVSIRPGIFPPTARLYEMIPDLMRHKASRGSYLMQNQIAIMRMSHESKDSCQWFSPQKASDYLVVFSGYYGMVLFYIHSTKLRH